MKSNATIMVCCHKKDFFYDGEGFFPIQVGKANSKVDLGIPGDNTGDNISEKNPNFCELTAQYWLWKKGVDTAYVGLNHYRRYFDFSQKNASGYYYQNISEGSIESSELDLPSNLEEIFNKFDIIMAKPIVYPVSLEIHYSIAHNKQDLAKMKEVIQQLYPEYIEAFNEVFKGNRMSLCNMFVMPKDCFNQYSKWLFDILFELEKKITVSSDTYQSRIFGFLAERLLNVYVKHNKMKVKHLPIIKISEDKPLSKLKGYVRNTMNDIAYSIIKRGDNCKIIFEKTI